MANDSPGIKEPVRNKGTGPGIAERRLSVFRVSDNEGSVDRHKNMKLQALCWFRVRIMRSRCSEFG
jgi:hypothetical protein